MTTFANQSPNLLDRGFGCLIVKVRTLFLEENMGFLSSVFGEPSEEKRIADRIAHLTRLENRGHFRATLVLTLYRQDPQENRFWLFNDEYLRE